jgi:hypothetical protein
MLIAAISIFASDGKHHTPDDSWEPNKEMYNIL